MGSAVFAATSDWSDLRAYAACAPGGGLTIAFINFSDNVTVALDVHGPPAGSPRALRVLSSVDNSTVSLNGAVLKYAPGAPGVLPPLGPASDAGDRPLVIEPHTLGFVSWPSASAYDC